MNKEKRHTDILRMGVLKAVGAIYKQGKRGDLLQYAPGLLNLIIEQNFKQHNNVLIRKLAIKVKKNWLVTLHHVWSPHG